MNDEDFISKFFFLYTSASKSDFDIGIVYPEKMDLYNILEEEDDNIRILSKKLINYAIFNSSSKKQEQDKPEPFEFKDPNKVIPSYLYAKILLNLYGSDTVINRFSLGLAIEVSEKNLPLLIKYKSRDEYQDNIESFKKFLDYISILCCPGIKLKASMNPIIYMPVPFFLKYAPSSPSWNLILFDVNKGYVTLDTPSIQRFFREVIFDIILRSVNGNMPTPTDSIMNNKKFIEDSQFISGLNNKYKQMEAENILSIDKSAYPPCIVHILMDMGMHGDVNKIRNVSHFGRFTIATFFNHFGLTAEQITEYFKLLPDFNRHFTLYQVKQIKERNYEIPKCDSLKTNNLCYSEEDHLCERVSHPMEFYKRKYMAKHGKEVEDKHEE
ncbi:MAG: hypothetical protein ACP5RS_02120 [Thermoplasmata archaeon]